MPQLRFLLCFILGLFLFFLAGCNRRDGDSFFVASDNGYELTEATLWNRAMVNATRSANYGPTSLSRAYFLVHSAMYDAFSLYDPVAIPTTLNVNLKRPVAEHTFLNRRAAVSYAAYEMLTTLFPEAESNSNAFTNLLFQLGYVPSTSTNTDNPAGAGRFSAITILASRANDGSNAQNGYADVISAKYPTLYAPVNSDNPADPNFPGKPGFNPNRWQPLRVPTGTVLDSSGNPVVDDNNPSSYTVQTFLTPHWGAVTPFALLSGSQFRPQAPPQAGSNATYTDPEGNVTTNDEAYQDQVDEVLEMSANLTDEEKMISEYWAQEGPGSITPPGHANMIAAALAERDRHTLEDDVKFYFALNSALFDTGITVWDAKRAYDYVRPISAIRHKYIGQLISAWGGPNLGTQTFSGETWSAYQPFLFVTPPFPEYTSGHSSFGMASAEVFTLFTGTTSYYDGVTQVQQDFNNDGFFDKLGEYIVRVNTSYIEAAPSSEMIFRWNTVQEAGEENGFSRLLGGIHFKDANLQSRIMGTLAARQAFLKAQSYWDGTFSD